MEGRQLEGVLVGLGPAVAQEQVIVRVLADAAQLFGQCVLQAVLDGIGIEAQLGNLIGDGLYIMRMAMADTDDGMPAIEVQILLTLGIPQRGTTPAYGFDVPPFIYIE